MISDHCGLLAQLGICASLTCFLTRVVRNHGPLVWHNFVATPELGTLRVGVVFADLRGADKALSGI